MHNYKNLMQYMQDFEKDPNKIQYITNNIEDIISYYDIDYLIKNGILIKLKKVAPEKFKDFHSLIISQLSKPSLIYSDPDLLNALTILAEEIAENEKTDISEIEYIGEGAYSKVSKLGNKVIKFGIRRFSYKMPYHRRILLPLIRREILPKKISYNDENFYVEIAEYIKPDPNITDDDVYLIYKELRDDGIFWLDPKKENLGRLEKENVIHYNKFLYVDYESLGFIPNNIKKRPPLQKGDLVIIDTDFLISEKDYYNSSAKDFFSRIWNSFEQRYQREKATENQSCLSISNSTNTFIDR